MEEIRIRACAYWQEGSTLMMEWRYPEMAFFDHVCITWSEERILVKRWVNMNSQDTERPLIEAVKKGGCHAGGMIDGQRICREKV